MMLVYFLTIIIIGTWALKMISDRKLLIKKTPLDIPILLFLLANILSTIFSIDPHTSWWGYYSRSNGGLLSIISYTLLYFALVSNFTQNQAIRLLKISLISGFFVAIYGVLEHFGIDRDFWVQDVQARVFSTLGQPNWLAAYLAMLIFPAIYFFLEAKTFWSRAWYYLVTVTLYAAFTFTYSRGATLGLLGGFVVFAFFQLLRSHPKDRKLGIKSRPDGSFEFPLHLARSPFSADSYSIIVAVNLIHRFLFKTPLALVLLSSITINLLFGSALTGNFRLIKQAAAPARPGIITESAPSVGTQLENGGTESGQIRLIVWKGAIDIFKNYPILGSGVETFAYSYYQFRPAEHNLVSEWDFLYNKAHNEYLNYLATTGAVGFGVYIALVGSFLVFSIWYLVFRGRYKIQDTRYKILCAAILAGYVGYLIQNFFGFSVVIIALYFYLFPAMAFILVDKHKPLVLPQSFSLFGSLFKNGAFRKIVSVTIFCLILYPLFLILNFWYADTLFAKGTSYQESGNIGKAYNFIQAALSLRGDEPLYKSELGFAASSAALALADVDATRSAELIEESDTLTEEVLKESPKNVSFWRTAVRTYYQLSALDSAFNQKTLDALNTAIMLAPTDPKLYHNKGLILGQLEQNDEAVKTLEKAVELKPNYIDVRFSLGLFYKERGENQKAKEQMEYILKLVPNHKEAGEKLKEWEEGKKE